MTSARWSWLVARPGGSPEHAAVPACSRKCSVRRQRLPTMRTPSVSRICHLDQKTDELLGKRSVLKWQSLSPIVFFCLPISNHCC
jgi:hypothetical protein